MERTAATYRLAGSWGPAGDQLWHGDRAQTPAEGWASKPTAVAMGHKVGCGDAGSRGPSQEQRPGNGPTVGPPHGSPRVSCPEAGAAWALASPVCHGSSQARTLSPPGHSWWRMWPGCVSL